MKCYIQHRWIFLCVIMMFASLDVFAAEPAQHAVISAMDIAEKWEGPYPPKVITEADGRKCLMFDLGKGGERMWSLKDFPKSKINMDDYDALKFDYRVEGGTFSLSTDVRQWPWYGGFLCLFYQIDRTPNQPSQWTTEIALAPENAWPTTYNRNEPCFRLNFGGTADPGKSLKIYIDNIRMVRYPFTVDCIKDIFINLGQMEEAKDGSIIYNYPLTVRNQTEKEINVQLDLDKRKLKHFIAEVGKKSIVIPPKGEAIAMVKLTLPEAIRKTLPPAYCELAIARFSLPGQPETEYAVNLLPAAPHKIKHPSLFATQKQLKDAKERMKKWGWAKGAANWYLNRAEFAMKLPDELPEYKPRVEQAEDKVCPKCKDKTKLRNVTTPRSIYRYQCETCGKMLSPKASFEHGTDGYWWHPESHRIPEDKKDKPVGHAISFSRYGNVLDLAIAWHLTDDDKYLQKLSKTLRNYIKVLPTYPSRSAGIAMTKFDAKGAYRIGNYFSQCGWLNRMAMVLDLVWDSGALTKEEREKLLGELKSMALTRLRIAMALQHRPNEAALAIALLSDDASMLAYLYNNPLNGGATQALQAFILNDGVPDMAGQYIQPPMTAWMDIIQVYQNAGLPLIDNVPGLRKFGTAMQLWQDPNGWSASLGDAQPMNCNSLGWYFERCYGWFGNPQDIIPVQRSKFKAWEKSKDNTPWESLERVGGSIVTARGAALFYGVENIPRGAPDKLRNSHDFPDYGLLVFNQGKDDKQLWAAIPYGKQVGHGHHDNMHLEWWALGQKISIKQGMRTRKHAVHENTLLVDGKDQLKVPCQITEFKGKGPVQGAVITSTDMYPGTTVQRTIMLYDGLIFLFDRFTSDTEHNYDMVYANAGTSHCDLPFQKVETPLGTEKDDNGNPANYALFQNIGVYKPTQPVQISWDNLKIPEIHVNLTQFATGDKGELFRVTAPLVKGGWTKITGDVKAAGYTEEKLRWMGNRADRSSLMGLKFIRRIHGKTAGLLTILEPFKGEKSRLSKIERLPLTLNGKPTEQGIALRYQAGGMTQQIIICPEPGVKKAGEAETRSFFSAGSQGFLQ